MFAKAKRHFWCVCVLFWAITCCSWEANASESQKNRIRSELSNILSQRPTVKGKMDLLKDLAEQHARTSAEPIYLIELYDLASSADSINYVYESIRLLGKYYSNNNDLESLKHWVGVVDSIANARNEVFDVQFQLHNYLCRYYLVSGDYEQAMNEAVQQQLIVDRGDNLAGRVFSTENIGLIYLLTGRNHDAIIELEKCLALLKGSEESVKHEVQVLASLARAYQLEGEWGKMETMLNFYREVVDSIHDGKRISDMEFWERRVCEIYYVNCVFLYVGTNRTFEAAEAVQNATKYIDETLDEDAWSIYHFAIASYYQYLKDYDKAIHHADSVTTIDYVNEAYRIKIASLWSLGKKPQALDVYTDLLKRGKESNVKAYTRQVDLLSMLNKLSSEEKRIHEQEIQAREIIQKRQLLFSIFIALGVLTILLMFLLHYSYRVNLLKRNLEKKKKTLQLTNANLLEAKNKAETADHLKSNFVANISHEIRTPLNAIVGFAGLLDGSSEEERKDYIDVINNNSDLLLNLVSDVLDLSRLEAVDFILNMQERNIQDCCQNALDTVRHTVQPGVALTFTHPEESVLVEIDSLRLQQLLINLLGNSAKFTEKGEINLNFRVDREAKQIVFSVTDTGCGIPLEKQKLIFERFEKLNDFKQGAGLGLSICKTLAERFGGDLFIDSSYTEGARFVFTLPY